MKRSALIIANGDPPKKQLLQSLVKAADFVVCADGGANIALKFGIQPDAIVGDMDSIHAEALVKFRRVETIEDHDDDSTDLEKAIRWVMKKKYDTIVIVCATGKRLDHTSGNLGVLVKFHSDASITMMDEHGELSYVGKEVRFEAERGQIVSLIPISRCEGIRTSGLEYALEDESLELGVREGTSNIVVSSPITIRVASGNLLLYKVFPSRK
jgi:thiamine pyrophosphokinase